jgi:hypothetical protein
MSFPPVFDRVSASRTTAGRRTLMATQKQTAAARRNVVKAKDAARRKRTISNLSASTRRDLGHQGAMARRRGGTAGHGYEDRTRQQLYEVAQKRNIRGRSKMGKWELIEALRRTS